MLKLDVMKSKIRSQSQLLILGSIGLLAIILAFMVDEPVTAYLRLRPEGWLYRLAGWLSQYGDWPFLLLAGILIVVMLFIYGRHELSRVFFVILIAGMLTGLSATIIRGTVGRTRPNSQVQQGFYGPYHNAHWTFGRYQFGSFPSGHTATVMGLAAALSMWRRNFGTLFTLFAMAVGWSRLALGRHYFSDVVAATIWGGIVAPILFSVLDAKFQHWPAGFSSHKLVTKDKSVLPKIITAHNPALN
jgi:membrane-associated phospholipid phosphatase